jgi:hypothetical protein
MRIPLLVLIVAASLTAALFIPSRADAYGGGAAHDMWQIGVSINCNNPDVCGDATGGFWGWLEMDRSVDGTQTWGDARFASCFHTIGGGAAGADHETVDFESWTIEPGSAGPKTFYASGVDTITYRGVSQTNEFEHLDIGISALPGHYGTDEILGFKAPGVAYQIQVAYRPAK